MVVEPERVAVGEGDNRNPEQLQQHPNRDGFLPAPHERPVVVEPKEEHGEGDQGGVVEVVPGEGRAPVGQDGGATHQLGMGGWGMGKRGRGEEVRRNGIQF